METPSAESSPAPKTASRRARTHASPSRTADTRKRTRATPGTSGTASHAKGSHLDTPVLPIDIETLEELQRTATRAVRTAMKDQPLALLGGTFAAGFLIGGGWRTRLGRTALLAASRYLVVEAAKHYLGA